jgi:hypothetical protein
MIYHSKTKHPHYPILGPLRNDKRIVGWWIHDPPNTIFTLPNPKRLSVKGWIQFGICCTMLLPCSFLPCFLSFNYEGYQCPVYEDDDI